MGAEEVGPGDTALVSISIGEHRPAVTLVRGDLELEPDINSETAALSGPRAALLDAAGEWRCMSSVANHRAIDPVLPPTGLYPFPAISVWNEPSVLPSLANDPEPAVIFLRQTVPQGVPSDAAVATYTLEAPNGG